MQADTEEFSGFMRVLTFVLSVLMVLVGGYLIFYPRFIVWIFSASVFLYGAQLIIRYFAMGRMRNGWDILCGAIHILFGALMLFGDPSTKVLGVVSMEIYLSVWAIFAGITHIFASLSLKKLGGANWIFVLLGGILMAIFGIAFLSMPLIASMGLVITVAIFTGISFIISGLTGLAFALSGSQKQKI